VIENGLWVGRLGEGAACLLDEVGQRGGCGGNAAIVVAWFVRAFVWCTQIGQNFCQALLEARDLRASAFSRFWCPAKLPPLY
jgi:hypothetical protein